MKITAGSVNGKCEECGKEGIIFDETGQCIDCFYKYQLNPELVRPKFIEKTTK
jgi:hypothetical protein